ncbi:hypothetical protein CPB85DRAFT_1364460 [Mucidula mucida]|nr:hypothetical protein CPB85DRAFT_1364460 [Mucidula mucida]
MSYGCTCGQCFAGWLSKRMTFQLDCTPSRTDTPSIKNTRMYPLLLCPRCVTATTSPARCSGRRTSTPAFTGATSPSFTQS